MGLADVLYDAVQLNNAFKLLEAIGETNSRNEKIDIMQQGIGNKCLEKILLYTYNTYWTYNVRVLDDYDYITADPYENENSMLRFHVFFDMLDKLRNRDITGNEAIDSLTEFFVTCNEEEGYWYYSVLLKDLDIGISEKTINKVFGRGFVPVFDCMLAKLFVEFPKKFVVLFKLDGYRCLAFNDKKGNVTLISRNGKQYFGFDDVEADIAKLPRGYVYDGELLSKNNNFSAMQRQGTKKAKGKNATMNVFDAISIEDFNKGKNNQPWLERRKFLVNNVKHANLENVSLLKSYGIFDSNDKDVEKRVDKIYNLALSMGYEGLITVDIDSPYMFKKGYHWQKIKPEETFDLTVVDFVEGSGKYVGTLGSIVVDFKGNLVNVGSGLIDKPDSRKPEKYTRDHIWKNRSKFLNKTIEVKSQEVTENLNNTPSLRFPVFLGFRFDK